MAFDGIVTQKIVKELKNILGFKIDKIYEPDKNTVTLGLYGKNLNLSLLICISSIYIILHVSVFLWIFFKHVFLIFTKLYIWK